MNRNALGACTDLLDMGPELLIAAITVDIKPAANDGSRCAEPPAGSTS